MARSSSPGHRPGRASASSAPGTPGFGAYPRSGLTAKEIGEGVLDWSDIYERLARRPDRPDAGAREELERRVRAWATARAAGLSRDDAEDVAQDTCAEVWRTFNLSRGGAAFEGFVQGRFVEALRRAHSAAAGAVGAQFMAPPDAAPAASTPSTVAPAAQDSPSTSDHGEARLAAALAELRARNPRHARALDLRYRDQATPEEAADELAVDTWALRSMIVRASQALAQRLERPTRKQRPSDSRRPAARAPGGKGGPRRSGRR